MKNYYFERDLQRKLEKAKRDISIVVLYDALKNVSEVARRLEVSRDTVIKVVKKYYTETQKSTYVKMVLTEKSTTSKKKATPKNDNKSAKNEQ